MFEWIGVLNTFADLWASSILRACWQGGLALLLVWAFSRLFSKISPSVLCWLWRLAFVKLLVSFVWTTPVDLPLLPKTHEPTMIRIPNLTKQGMKAHLPASPLSLSSAGGSLLSDEEKTQTRTEMVLPNFASILLSLWLLGLCWHFASLLRSWLMFMEIRSSVRSVEEPNLLSEFAELGLRFKLRCLPNLTASEKVLSPLLLGAVRPTIILPAEMVQSCSLNQLKFVLAHELAHLRRKDLFWNWLLFLGKALFFFHPAVWVAKNELQLAQEMACDELVILVTNTPPATYGEVLVRVAKSCCSKKQENLAAVGMSESYHALKRRLMAMQFVRPIPRTKALVWCVALVSLAVAGIVPWRLVAQPSSQTSQTQQVHATSHVPLKKGLELTYEGLARVVVGGEEKQVPIKVNEFVKEVKPDGTATVVSLRVFRHPADKSDISLRLVSVQPNGGEVPPDEKYIPAEVPPKLFSLHFFKVLPVYFIPQRNLKVGSSWVTREHLPGYLYVTTVNNEFQPWVEVEMRNRVVKQAQIGGVKCWVIRRTLTKPIPIHGGDWAKRLSERKETLWVDARTGLIRQVEAETVLEGQKGKFRHNALQLQLKSQRTLTGSALDRRLKELQWIEGIREKFSKLFAGLQVYELWKTLDLDKIDQAQNLVKSLLQDVRLFVNRLFPNSPYTAYLAGRGGELVYLDGELERLEEYGERVGEPAPDFELTTVNGERIRLSDLRGKVVLLNFGVVGVLESDILSQQWRWVFDHAEQIHREYKDKGVVVLGIWRLYPPERKREIVEALKVTFTILVDEDGKVYRMFKLTAIPTYIVIGKDGKVRFIMTGYTDGSPLRKAIETALSE